jgi:hypothetical protein
MLISAKNGFRLQKVFENNNNQRLSKEMLTSTKLAVFPSSSTPRVLNLVPALFHPKRDINDKVAIVGAPSVGGAGNAIVKTPT